MYSEKHIGNVIINITLTVDISDNIIVLSTNDNDTTRFLQSLDMNTRPQVLELSSTIANGKIVTLPFIYIHEYSNTSNGEEHDVYLTEVSHN
jgi:hypothetical protein